VGVYYGYAKCFEDGFVSVEGRCEEGEEIICPAMTQGQMTQNTSVKIYVRN